MDIATEVPNENENKTRTDGSVLRKTRKIKVRLEHDHKNTWKK